MIRTFEGLRRKMEADGCRSRRLQEMYEEHQHWKGEADKDDGINNLTAYVYLHMCREKLLGYLSCLQDIEYICQGEYDQLWGSLEKGENDD